MSFDHRDLNVRVLPADEARQDNQCARSCEPSVPPSAAAHGGFEQLDVAAHRRALAAALLATGR